MKLLEIPGDSEIKNALKYKKGLEETVVKFCLNSHEACSAEQTVFEVFKCIDRENGCNFGCPHTTKIIVTKPNTFQEKTHIDPNHHLDADKLIKEAISFLQSQQNEDELMNLYEYFEMLRVNVDSIHGGRKKPYLTDALSENGKKQILKEVTDPIHNQWVQQLYQEELDSTKYNLALRSLKNWITQEASRIKNEVQEKINQALKTLQ